LTTGQPASSIGEPDRQRSRLARSPPGRAADLHCPLPCAVTTSMQLLFCVASAAIATSRSRLACGGAPPSDLRRVCNYGLAPGPGSQEACGLLCYQVLPVSSSVGIRELRQRASVCWAAQEGVEAPDDVRCSRLHPPGAVEHEVDVHGRAVSFMAVSLSWDSSSPRAHARAPSGWCCSSPGLRGCPLRRDAASIRRRAGD